MKQERINIEGIAYCLCTFYNNGRANVMIIDDVWVDPEKRDQGYGKTLIKQALELADKENVDSVELVVNQDNMVAKKLYEGQGFSKPYKDFYRKILHYWNRI